MFVNNVTFNIPVMFSKYVQLENNYFKNKCI